MKLRGFLYSMFVTAILVAMSSCSKTPKCVSMLHDDPVVVARIDVRQLAEKGELSKEKDAIEEQLSSLSEEARKKIKEILDDPVNLGLDLRDPIFASVDESGDFRVVGTVYDADDFRDFLKAMSKDAGIEVKEKDDLTTVDLDGGILAFDGDCFLITQGEGSPKKIFEGDSKLVEDKDFAEMCDREGDVQVLVKGEPIAKVLENQKDVADRLKNVSLLYDLSFNQGEVVQTFETLFKDADAKKRFEQYTAMAGEIQGDFAEYFSKNGFVIFGNIDGGKLYESLDKFDILERIAPAFGISEKDAESLIKSFKGDFAFGINDFGRMNTGNGALYVSMSSDKLLKIIEEAAQGELKPAGTNQFAFVEDGANIALGYKKGAFYATAKIDSVMGASFITPFEKAKNALSKNDVKGKGTGLYAFLNFRMFDSEPQAKEVFKDVDYAEAYYDKDFKFIIRVVLQDKEKNSLVPFVKFLYNMAPKTQYSIPYESYEVYPEMEEDDFFADDDLLGEDAEKAAELEELMN